MSKERSNTMGVIRLFLIFFLFMNLLIQLIDLGYTADIIKIYKYKSEYVKKKVLVDSLVQEGHRQPMGG